MGTMSRQDELNELLSQLVGNLREDDLDDPELSLILSQLVMILEGHPIELPQSKTKKNALFKPLRWSAL
jgi:hypothetical protein